MDIGFLEDDLNSRHWYALYTRAKGEVKAAEAIAELSVEYYLPVVKRTKQWSDRTKTISEPLIKGYIFIWANRRERVKSLENNYVVRCIFDSGKAAVIPEWQIDNLKRMLENKSEFFVSNEVVAGTKVKIVEGPFMGVIGTVHETSIGKTITISIDLLKRSVIAHLPKESVLEVIHEF